MAAMRFLRPFRRSALVALWFALAAGIAQAQAGGAITLRMIDSHSGRMIANADFLVRIDHQPTEHADWVTPNDDGSGKLTVPADAKLILVHAKYDNAMSVYVNCDTESKGKIPTLNTQGEDRWYAISDILGAGIVAHNGCGRGKDDANFTPKPGEFVFFVRKHNWREAD